MFDLATTSTDRIAVACEKLRASDRLIAEALAMLSDCDVEASTGLSTELMLGLQARRTRGDASVIANAAQVSRIMPFTFAAFRRGDLSWGQVRAICASVRQVDTAGRAHIDDLVASLAPGLTASDPELLLGRVDDAVAGLRADLAIRREQRAIDTSFLAIKGALMVPLVCTAKPTPNRPPRSPRRWMRYPRARLIQMPKVPLPARNNAWRGSLRCAKRILGATPAVPRGPVRG